jgi:hypothetical protein
VSAASTNPAANANNVCPDAAVNATFSVPSGLRMDPASISAANFTLTGPAGVAVVPASVALDAATGRIATFTPLAPLPIGAYSARLRSGASGVKDLAVPGNTMVNDFVWGFTVASCAVVPPPVPFPLGAAAPFGVFGGSAGTTNQGILTVIHGDIGTTGVSTTVTGFHDAGPGCTYTETPLNIGAVNGLVFTAPPPPTPACPSEGTAVTLAVATPCPAARTPAPATWRTSPSPPACTRRPQAPSASRAAT